MDLDSIKWILFGSIIGIGLVVIFAKYILRKSRLIDKDQSINEPSKITCEAENCGVWYSREAHNDKYCEYHTNVFKTLNTLKKGKNQNHYQKAEMYMSFDNRSLSNVQRDKIIKELNGYIAKNIKNNKK